MVNPARKGKHRKTQMKHTRRKSRKGGRKKGGKKGRSAYNMFVKRELPRLVHKGMAAKTAMKKVGSMWRGKHGGVKHGAKKHRAKKHRTSRRRGRSNWGTKSGGLKGWNKRESHAAGHARTRGARYPRASGKRKVHHRKVKANPRRGRSHRRKGRKAGRKKSGRRRSRHNPVRPATLAKIDAHIRPSYGKAHMKFMSACLRQRGGRHGMKACQKQWKSQSKKYGKPQPHWTRRANQSGALATVQYKAQSAMTRLGFPTVREAFPAMNEIKAHKVATIGGATVGAGGSFVGWQVLSGIAKDSAPGQLVLGSIGGIVGTEIPARAYHKWGKEKPSKNTAVKSMRLGGYAMLGFNAVRGVMALASASKSGKLSGLGDVADKAKEVAKKAMSKVKEALGVGIFGSNKGMEDVISSGWDQGYTGYEPLGVSGDAMTNLDARIKSLAKELGLSDADVVSMMREEGYDVGYLDYQMAGWGKDEPSRYQTASGMGAYDTYVENPYGDEIGQYGSPSVPLLSDSTIPPAERDIYRSDFVV